jgi:hypothetical protein
MSIEKAYDNLEKIITDGFLSLPLDCGGSRVVLKTITNNEYRDLRFSLPDTSSEKYGIYRFIYSTYMLNGIKVLDKRDDYLQDLYSFYDSCPYLFLKTLNSELDKLNTEYIDSLKYFEGFCYSKRSRYLWKILNGQHIASSEFFGSKIKLGLNSVQENWTVINQNMDNEEQYEVQFNLSVMVASSMNSKGAKSISTSYTNRKNELVALREEISRYGYDKKRVVEETRQAKWTAPMKTKADIVRELDRQMRGDKDLHDKFFDKWIEDQKKKAEEVNKAIEKKQVEYRKSLEDMKPELMEGSRAATPEEVKRLRAPIKNLDRDTYNYMKLQRELNFIKKTSATIIKQEN